MTGDQARQARELLGLTKFRLSQQSGIPVGTIERFERTGKMTERKVPYMSPECRRAELQVVLEAAGAVFATPVPTIEAAKTTRAVLTGAQVFWARRLLQWSSKALGERCDIAEGTIRRFERTDRMARSDPSFPPVDRLALLRSTFEQAGIEFGDGEQPKLKGTRARQITGAQVREARQLLDWSSDVLASRSGISVGVVGHFERTNRMMKPHPGTGVVDRTAHLEAVLEAAGVEFTNEDAPGVKLRRVDP